jgi:hypothetical protein
VRFYVSLQCKVYMVLHQVGSQLPQTQIAYIRGVTHMYICAYAIQGGINICCMQPRLRADNARLPCSAMKVKGGTCTSCCEGLQGLGSLLTNLCFEARDLTNTKLPPCSDPVAASTLQGHIWLLHQCSKARPSALITYPSSIPAMPATS